MSRATVAALILLALTLGTALVTLSPGWIADRPESRGSPPTAGEGRGPNASSQLSPLPPAAPDAGNASAPGDGVPAGETAGNGSSPPEEIVGREDRNGTADQNETEVKYGFVGTVGRLRVYRAREMNWFVPPLTIYIPLSLGELVPADRVADTLREMGVPPDVPLPTWLPPCAGVALVVADVSGERGGLHVWFFRNMEEATMGVPNESVLCLNTTVFELAAAWNFARHRIRSQEEIKARFEYVIKFDESQTAPVSAFELACGTNLSHERVIYIEKLGVWADARDYWPLHILAMSDGNKLSVYCEEIGWPPRIEQKLGSGAFLIFYLPTDRGMVNYDFTGWRADCGLDALIEIAESLRPAAEDE